MQERGRRDRIQRVLRVWRDRVPQQVTRLLVLFVILAVALLAARSWLVPPTFGVLGHYRAAAIDEAMAAPLRHAGRHACATCHSDVADVQSRAQHQTLSCETCHGPAAAHADDPGSGRPTIPRERNFCPRCHGYDPARPTGFPQIDPVAHNPLRACVSCHNPHAPGPPRPPSTCAACHGEIARVKAVSHHTELPCTRCHETEDAHMETPRLSRPAKPQSREFCGGCHAEQAQSPREIPRVDLNEHGSHYVCWQCHYPHYPEVGS